MNMLQPQPHNLNSSTVRPTVRKQPNPLWWLGLALCLLFFIGGGLLWVAAIAKHNQARPIAATPDPASIEPTLTADQRNAFKAAYNQAQQDFNAGKLQDATNTLEPVVKVDPNFNQDAVAVLFICYRANGLAQMESNTTDKNAANSFNLALALLNSYPQILRSQFQHEPSLLPKGFSDFDTMTADLIKQKNWIELYTKAESADPSSNPTWFTTAINNWKKIYDDNPDFLKNNTERWVVTRLLSAYSAQANYYCTTKKNYKSAKSSLETASTIATNQNLVQQQTQLDNQLKAYTISGCS